MTAAEEGGEGREEGRGEDVASLAKEEEEDEEDEGKDPNAEVEVERERDSWRIAFRDGRRTLLAWPLGT